MRTYLKLGIYNLLQCPQLEGYLIKQTEAFTYPHLSACLPFKTTNDGINEEENLVVRKNFRSRRKLQKFDVKETSNQESRFKRGFICPKALIKNLLKKFNSKIKQVGISV